MTITGHSALAKDEIERMVRDAETHAAEDKRRREEAEVRNHADSTVYQTEKLLKDQGEKFTDEEKREVESALADLKSKLAGNDIEAIRSSTEALLRASQAFAQRLYQQASAQDGASGSGDGSSASAGEPTNDDEVVDAEIVDEGRG